MKSHVKLVLACVSIMALVAAFALAGCASASSSKSTSESSSASSASAADSSGSSSSSSGSNAASTVTIGLDYNAGTGYEWTCTADPEGILELTGQTTLDDAEGGVVEGGPLHDEFTFKATSPGEATLTFDLVRPWEEDEEPADSQVYAFTVNDDLEIILNPYKSNFDNEPVIGTAQ